MQAVLLWCAWFNAKNRWAREAWCWTHLPKPQLSDREGYLQAPQGTISSRDGMGQAHSINKYGLCYFQKPDTQWIQSSECPAPQGPPVHLWEHPNLHTQAPTTHTRPAHNHHLTTSQPEAYVHDGMVHPVQWDTAREEAQTGLAIG